MAELCKSWSARWDEYVRTACWIQRTTPDPCLPSGGTPFRILFGRDAHTNLDALTPALDDGFRTGMDNFVADKHQTFLELREILKKRQEDKNRRRVRLSAAIMRHSSGERARVGDVMLVKEADSKMVQEGTHAKLAHEHSMGPWQVTAIEQPGISYQVTMSGRRIRRRTVSAAYIKAFYLRPEHLRHAFEDEFAHLAWGADLEFADISTVVVPLYTLRPAGRWEHGKRVVAIPRAVPRGEIVGVASGRGGAGQLHPAAAQRFSCLMGSVQGRGPSPPAAGTAVEGRA